MIVYVTKYALTKGILEFDAITFDGKGNGMIQVGCGNDVRYFHKPYWHSTIADARQHAEKLRVKKLESLRDQLGKLENLDFSSSDVEKAVPQ